MDHFRSWGHTDTKKISYKTGGASKEKTGENQSENKRRRGGTKKIWNCTSAIKMMRNRGAQQYIYNVKANRNNQGDGVARAMGMMTDVGQRGIGA